MDLNEKETELETKNAPEQSTSTSTGDDGWDASANKPYMRQLGKKYWGDERLKQFDSIGGLVDAYFEATQSKAPESYGDIPEDMSKAFKEMDLSKDNADKVLAMIEKAKPEVIDTEKVLRERHNEDYDTFKSQADKAINAFMDENLKELSEKYRLSSNPAFVEFASKVGHEVGDDFHDKSGESRGKPTSVNPFYELAKKSVGMK